MNILFVCTGNTCRSAMAAGLMDKIVRENNMDVFIESAGIFAVGGDNASKNAILAMKKYDVDLSLHKSQPVTEELIFNSDLILTMTCEHKRILEPMAKDKIFTLSEYAGRDCDISDPYGGDLVEYEKAASEIYEKLLKVSEKILDK